MIRLSFKSREDFRSWLSENHSSEEPIWIEFYKDGRKGIEYTESLEEALCFGWIDSLIKKVDERIYLRRFSLRNNKSKWSNVNKDLVGKLTAEKRMTKYGIEKVEAAKKNGTWDHQKELSPGQKDKMVEEFLRIIESDVHMSELFGKKSKRMKQLIAAYYFDAKTEETRKRRKKRISGFLQGKIIIL
jgi:uncharacterized protein YdeI (YjbR/CyaY-like superfamily)